MIYIKLQRENGESLTKQIYKELKQQILQGIIKDNEKLPSQRALAEELSVARNIIIEVYEQLSAEGYVYSIAGSGTYVNVGVQIRRAEKHLQEREVYYQEKPKESTPIISFRTGIIMPVKRRIELVEYARKNDAYIVEDDYDSEFRFDGPPIQCMQDLDPERVIYVGTFSKTLMPAIRIGYMILPDTLCNSIREKKYIADIHSPNLEQIVLARFLEEGIYERHIAKMRKKCLKKRNYLIECLKEEFLDDVVISGAQAGLHFFVTFQSVTFTKELLQTIQKNGIEITPVSKHYYEGQIDVNAKHTLVFGYGNTNMKDMKRACKILKNTIVNK